MQTITLSDSLAKEIDKVAQEFGYTEEKAANYFNQTISRSNVHHYKITYGNLLHVKDFDSITLDDKVQIHFKKYDILSSQ